MKAHFITTEDIHTLDGLDEAHELLRISYTIEETDLDLRTKWNPYYKAWWGDFVWLRSLFTKPVDIRGFITTKQKLKADGITKHIGMYDLTDNDGVLDFYVGVPTKLDARAQKNGFTTNLAWLICHEVAHGREQSKGTPDRVHTMEAQGRLKELLAEYRRDDMQAQINTLTRLLEALIALLKPSLTLHRRLPDPYNNVITQQYGVLNPIYPRTGRHIGTDYGCPVGTPIFAPFDGEVTATGTSKALGNYAIFEYTYKNQKRVERHLHLQTKPAKGPRKRGEVLALSGDTGKITGAHYHVDGWYNEVNLKLIFKDNWHLLTYDPHIA